MQLMPFANETHVDEAIRLFNFATMNAIQSGIVEGQTRGAFSEQVQKLEELILRRFPIGSCISERRLTEQLVGHNFSEATVSKAIYKLTQKDVLAYEERRTKLRRQR